MKTRAVKSLVLAVVCLGWILSSTGYAAIITFTNTSGNWNTAANWSPNQVPGIADTAVISNGGTVTVSGSVIGGSVDLSSGTLAGIGPLLVDSSFNWSGGDINCATTIETNATMTINTDYAEAPISGTFTNAGTVNSGDSTYLYVGAGVVNLPGGVFNLITDWGGLTGGGSFTNAGYLTVSGDYSEGSLGIPLINIGTVVADGPTVAFSQITSLGGVLSGGCIAYNINVNAATVLDNFSLDSIWPPPNGPYSTFVGNNVLNGTLAFFSGGIGVGASVTVATNSVMTLYGSDVGFTFDGPLTNAGTINWIPQNYNLQTQFGIVNLPGAVFDAEWNETDSPAWISGSGAAYFSNAGLVVASMSESVYQDYQVASGFDLPFTNTGILEVTNGPLAIGEAFQGDTGALNLGIDASNSIGSVVFSDALNLASLGTANVRLCDGFLPTPGETFTLLDYPSVTGHFEKLGLPPQVSWKTIENSTSYEIEAEAFKYGIAGINQNADGSVTLTVAGTTNSGILVEATTNLALPGSWTPIYTNSGPGPNGLWEFTDTAATNYPHRYYSIIPP